ncbi:MAG: hypothetical protein GX230_00105 [Lentisphaerae bacterium]|mgnify:CR=1 FL=1|jgi:biopolymer transport protein ExbD|nr:hypothetical protein [Lentisphaerota bacterium]
MAGETHIWDRWRTTALRDKYRPKTLLGQAFLVAVPWLDVLLVCGFFLWAGSRVTLRPGVVFDLPVAPFQEGLYDTVTMVLMPAGDITHSSATLVFFDDERYNLADQQQRVRLGDALRGIVSHTLRRDLLLLADQRVPHGDVMMAVNLARAVGLQRVNVGVKPE